MMRPAGVIFIFMILVLGTTRVLADTQCKILTDQMPPFNEVKNQKVVGFSVDLLKAMFQKTNYTFDDCQFNYAPWPRAYMEIQQNPETIIFSVGRTPLREKMFKWVGPIYTVKGALIGKKSHLPKISSLSELSRFKIGTVINTAPEQFLVAHGISPEQLERVPTPEMNIKKLAVDRIDYMAQVFISVSGLMKKMEIEASDYEEVLFLEDYALHYAFHPDTPDHRIKAFQKALNQLKHEPFEREKSFYEILLKKYGLAPLS